MSALPVEVLRYVLQWVASVQLDMRAIEQVAKVSWRKGGSVEKGRNLQNIEKSNSENGRGERGRK